MSFSPESKQLSVMEVGTVGLALPVGEKTWGINYVFWLLFKIITLKFCRSEVWHGSYWSKVKVVYRATFLSRGEAIPLLSKLLEAGPHSLVLGPPPPPPLEEQCRSDTFHVAFL